MFSFKHFITEIFDKPLKTTKLVKDGLDYRAAFYLFDKKKTFLFSALNRYRSNYEIVFTRYNVIPEYIDKTELYKPEIITWFREAVNNKIYGTIDLTSDLGADSIKVIGTIAQLTVEFVSEFKPEVFSFSSKYQEYSRTKLYRTLANKLIQKFPEYELSEDVDDEWDEDEEGNEYNDGNINWTFTLKK
jgi:acyl carrier protein